MVASLWQVNDEATRLLMTLFYANLWTRNLPASEALRQAQLSLLNNPRFAAPRYWAAFPLSGRW